MEVHVLMEWILSAVVVKLASLGTTVKCDWMPVSPPHAVCMDTVWYETIKTCGSHVMIM